jgi:glyoxylase-like metal-dependent hydrolase (beta-lactamase superfamily II)
VVWDIFIHSSQVLKEFEQGHLTILKGKIRILQPEKIREQLYLLGQEESCVYLLEGHHESMIINGGMSYLVPDILSQFKRLGIDETRITKLLLLHSHFDHVGTVPFSSVVIP